MQCHGVTLILTFDLVAVTLTFKTFLRCRKLILGILVRDIG